ncbi:MAG: KamA family radical SAM protein [Lachnospiraceae bacterium]|nr:KamA family radical SAM protein [Lachnospiraceae bacterium]
MWRELLRENVTTAEELIEPLKLTNEEYEEIRDETEQFPMSVTRYYLSLIDPDDPEDPIRKMAIPAGRTVLTDGVLDTSGEHSNTKLQGMQHKYRETVMVLTTPVCAMFCRHCFRRRLVGKETGETAVDKDAIIGYIKDHPEVTNVLLSGGDSFMLSTEAIAGWLDRLSGLDQLDFIRFGTRTIVTFPQRITMDPELVKVLGEYSKKKQIYVVTHFNHPKEITPESMAAVKALQGAGVVIKNQTVLMKGINDDKDVLTTLLKKVSSLGIVQHYIFQCRPVQGVRSRFQVPIARGSRLVSEALACQNGLGKSADYAMSHVTGKMRILGETGDGRMLFQYKQAKDRSNLGRIVAVKLGEDQTWLDDDFETVHMGSRHLESTGVRHRERHEAGILNRTLAPLGSRSV